MSFWAKQKLWDQNGAPRNSKTPTPHSLKIEWGLHISRQNAVHAVRSDAEGAPVEGVAFAGHKPQVRLHFSASCTLLQCTLASAQVSCFPASLVATIPASSSRGARTGTAAATAGGDLALVTTVRPSKFVKIWSPLAAFSRRRPSSQEKTVDPFSNLEIVGGAPARHNGANRSRLGANRRSSQCPPMILI